MYFTGVTLARARLDRRRARIAPGRRWLPVGVLTFGAVAVVAATVVLRAGRHADRQPSGCDRAILTVAHVAAARAHRPAGRSSALARPLFAEWPRPYLRGTRLGGRWSWPAVLTWVLLERRSVPGGGGATPPSAPRRTAGDDGRARLQGAVAAWALAPTGRPEIGVRLEGGDADAAHGRPAQSCCDSSQWS